MPKGVKGSGQAKLYTMFVVYDTQQEPGTKPSIKSCCAVDYAGLEEPSGDTGRLFAKHYKAPHYVVRRFDELTAEDKADFWDNLLYYTMKRGLPCETPSTRKGRPKKEMQHVD